MLWRHTYIHNTGGLLLRGFMFKLLISVKFYIAIIFNSRFNIDIVVVSVVFLFLLFNDCVTSLLGLEEKCRGVNGSECVNDLANIYYIVYISTSYGVFQFKYIHYFLGVLILQLFSVQFNIFCISIYIFIKFNLNALFFLKIITS